MGMQSQTLAGKEGHELEAFSLQQVGFLVGHVIVGVAEDGFFVFFVEVAAEFSWGAHPEGIGLYYCVLWDQGTGGDDGAGADDGAVEDDAAHAYEAAGFDGAAVENDGVAHGYVVADVDTILFLHAVEDAVVLDVGVVADANLVDIAAEDGVHPDAGVLAYDYVADELGGVVDVSGFGELGGDAFVGADHRFGVGVLSCFQLLELRTENISWRDGWRQKKWKRLASISLGTSVLDTRPQAPATFCSVVSAIAIATIDIPCVSG